MTRGRTIEWLALIVLFLIAGTVGHDPWWKPGEAYSFGIVYHFYTTHTWLIPIDAGVPFMEKPPIYYWTAASIGRALGDVLPLHDAVRLASTFYMGVSCLFLWLTAGVLLARDREPRTAQWLCVTLMLGTYGMIPAAHAMITDIALLAGTTIALHGMALLCLESGRWVRAGIWLGLGTGIAFLSKGLVMPVILGITELVLITALPQLRTRNTMKIVALAFIVASPFLFIWPALVYHESPALFSEWFWENNVGRFIGSSVAKLGAENKRGNLLLRFPAFTFPVFPLACVTLWCHRRQWGNPAILLPAAFLVTAFTLLLASASCRAVYLMPLIPFMALLAAPAMLTLPDRFLLQWNRVARVAFTAAAAAAWLVWWNLRTSPQQRLMPWLASYFNDVLPSGFTVEGLQPVAVSAALLALCFWAASFRFSFTLPLQTARIWFTGAALLWCTTHTLLLPWINETKSFRTVISRMQQFVKNSPYAGNCIAHYQLGENMAPMIQYFSGLDKPLPVITLDDHNTCPLFLTFARLEDSVQIDPAWHMIWHSDPLVEIRTNELRLYTHQLPVSSDGSQPYAAY